MTYSVPLSRGMFALVDDADAQLVIASGPWHARPGAVTFYARHSISDHEQIDLHQFLTGWERTDHINGDGLDNRRSNLRPASRSENARNRGKTRSSTSDYKGVTLHRNSRWRAQIGHEGQNFHIGCFSTAAEAARAYDQAARELHGEFAHLNFPLKETSA